MTETIRQKLSFEAVKLQDTLQLASLIVDEAAMKEKYIYDKQMGAIVGLKECPKQATTATTSSSGLIMANRVLCFVFHGLMVSVPCSCYFTKQLSGRHFHQWTKRVIQEVEECGFPVMRRVADNYSANVTMVRHFGNRTPKELVQYPFDNQRASIPATSCKMCDLSSWNDK